MPYGFITNTYSEIQAADLAEISFRTAQPNKNRLYDTTGATGNDINQIHGVSPLP
jgi:hypothetical protein